MPGKYRAKQSVDTIFFLLQNMEKYQDLWPWSATTASVYILSNA